MSAQPIHEEPGPRDPQVILERLPERERAFFLTQYKTRAQAAAEDVAGYAALRRFLHHWSIRARGLERALAENPNYYEDLDADIAAIRAGTLETVPIEEALAQVLGMSQEDATAFWQQQVEQARQRSA